VQTMYRYLVERSDKGTQELYMRGTGVRTSTIWHNRYIFQMYPRIMAHDRNLSVDAVCEAMVLSITPGGTSTGILMVARDTTWRSKGSGRRRQAASLRLEREKP
jgi:hypothetical protein